MRKESLITKEIAGLPKELQHEVMDYIRFLKEHDTDLKRRTEALKEKILNTQWFTPDNDDAWRNFKR